MNAKALTAPFCHWYFIANNINANKQRAITNIAPRFSDAGIKVLEYIILSVGVNCWATNFPTPVKAICEVKKLVKNNKAKKISENKNIWKFVNLLKNGTDGNSPCEANGTLNWYSFHFSFVYTFLLI